LGAKRREHGEHLAFVDLRDYSVSSSASSTGASTSGASTSSPSPGRSPPARGHRHDKIATGAVELGSAPSRCSPPRSRRRSRSTTHRRRRADPAQEPLHRHPRPRMQANLRLRATVNSAIRAAMERQGFCEVETPLLWAPPRGRPGVRRTEPPPPGILLRAPQSRSSPSSCSWSGGWTATTRSPAACATRTARRSPVRVHPARHGGVIREPADVLAFVSEPCSTRRSGHRRAPGPYRADDVDRGDRPLRHDKPDLRFGMELVELSGIFASTECAPSPLRR